MTSKRVRPPTKNAKTRLRPIETNGDHLLGKPIVFSADTTPKTTGIEPMSKGTKVISFIVNKLTYNKQTRETDHHTTISSNFLKCQLWIVFIISPPYFIKSIMLQLKELQI